MTLAPAHPLVLIGPIAPLGKAGQTSAIVKASTPGPWRIGKTGLEGDAQADLKHHGGPEKALHHYAFDHYATWRAEIGDAAPLAAPGAFGENLSTSGWTEETVRLGDVIRFGSALLQVSQGRQPCFKLSLRFGLRDMAARVQRSGRTGWYYRVLQEGVAQLGDALALIERPCPDWPLARLSTLLYRDTRDRAGLAAMAALPQLAEGWRALAQRRLDTGKTENWSARLYGRQRQS
ncbi:MOSC domain-containing protein [Methylocystis sp. Sn-Cys]|uniref:MOSC domain-containing protein n=1 Tax=Methylocystis sp. Sn-Cys TaxID=1701263 RepID=UPI001920B12E|nr:MOSC domain-containing protein [Methylocystis sp. Sn-Cys]MBL1258325.1 MOSC domain-containing protein [Methylocystis sp. Sn-Cys]